MASSSGQQRDGVAYTHNLSSARWILLVLFLVVAGVSYRYSPPFLALALVASVRLPVRFSPAVLLAGLVTILATFSLNWSIDPGKSWLAIQNAWACLATFLLFYWGIKTRIDLKRALVAVAVSGVIVALVFLAFAEPPSQVPYYGYVESGQLRPTLPGVNVNYLAYVMATGVAAAAALLRLFGSELSSKSRAAATIGVSVCALGIWQSGTRGAAVSLVAVFGAYLLTRFWAQSVKRVMMALVVASAAWSLLGLVLDPKWIRAVEGLFPRQTGDLGARLPLWEAAGGLLKERPSLGLGVSGYTVLLDGVYAHNAFLSIALGMGLLGVVLFTLFIIASTYTFATSGDGGGSRFAAVSAIFLAAFLPIWISGVWEWSLWAWAGLGVCAAANGLSSSDSDRHRRSSGARPAVHPSRNLHPRTRPRLRASAVHRQVEPPMRTLHVDRNPRPDPQLSRP